MFETQKSRNKTSSGDIGLNIRTIASPKVGQDQVSGGVSVLCWQPLSTIFHVAYQSFWVSNIVISHILWLFDTTILHRKGGKMWTGEKGAKHYIFEKDMA